MALSDSSKQNVLCVCFFGVEERQILMIDVMVVVVVLSSFRTFNSADSVKLNQFPPRLRKNRTDALRSLSLFVLADLWIFMSVLRTNILSNKLNEEQAQKRDKAITNNQRRNEK